MPPPAPTFPRPPRGQMRMFPEPLLRILGPALLVVGGLILAGCLGLVGPRHRIEGRIAVAPIAVAVIAFGETLRREQRRRGAEWERRVRVARERPHEPWLTDHPWELPRYEEDWRHDRSTLAFAAAALAPLCLGFALTAIVPGPAPVALRGCLALLVLPALAIWLLCRIHVRRYRRFGPATIELRTAPLRPGDPLEATVTARIPPESEGRIVATLRCLRSRHVRASAGSTHTNTVEGRDVHNSPVEVGPFSPAADGISFPVLGRIPADAEPARLAELPMTVWQLELRSDATRPPWDVVFLLPVYR